MKKILMAAAALCCAMTTTVFTACGGDDDDNGNTQKSDNTPAYAEMTFTFWGTQDMLDIADMTVTYNDGTGDKTETVTTVDWVKTVKAVLPVSFKFERKVTLKEGVTLSDDQTYSYISKHQTKYSVTTAKGTTLKSGTAGALTKQTTSVKGDKINLVITSGLMDASYTYDFDKNGKCPQLDSPAAQ
ncbi:MAG: hypothetical protein J6Z14_05705 [Prevotella sp.]|nr:hypothetical protein [Prevotella sp.]